MTIVIVTYLGSSGGIFGKPRDRNFCHSCASPLEATNASIFCSVCENCYQKDCDGKRQGTITKCAIILATIGVDIVLLLGSGFLAGAVLQENNLALGVLAIPAIFGMFCYIIGGNKVTYRLLKSLSESRRGFQQDIKINWKPARDALAGDGFMVGVALFVIFTLITTMIVVAAQFGDAGDESYYGLVKMIVIVVLMILILPLLGIAAKLVGNEKAAAECGYNGIRRIFLVMHNDGNRHGDGESSTGENSFSS